MAFSESFGLGNSTFFNLDKVAQNALDVKINANSKQQEANGILEIIEESPTNFNKNLGKSRIKNIGYTQNSLKRRKRLQKSKSDSILESRYAKTKLVSRINEKSPSFKSENYSEFFKTDFSLDKNVEISVENNCMNVSELEKMCETMEKRKQSDLKHKRDLNEMFEDSIGFTQLMKEPIINECLLNKNSEQIFVENSASNTFNLDNPICSKELAIALQETTFPDNSKAWNDSKHFKSSVLTDSINPKVLEGDVEEIINIDDSSFLFFGNTQTDIENELKISKKEISNVFKSDSISKANVKETTINKSMIKCAPHLNGNDDKNVSDRLKKVVLDDHGNPCISIEQFKNEDSNNCHINDKQVDLQNISSWSLPNSILKEYENKGITKMFDWQIECLKNPKILFDHSNLVYSAPTSAGKTLVSEILMIKTVLERNKKVVLILPFISVVREKMFYLQDLLIPSGYRVEGFFGGYTPPGGFESINVAICTIEKANAIINKLLEQGKLDDIGIVVVDEIHLISDPGRGYILELLLAKILYMSKKYSFQIQVVAMSATLANIELLKIWLSSELYITTFRPVELKEMIKIGNKIYNNELKFLRDIKTDDFSILNDPDHVCQLSLETIAEGCSVVIFCPSKDWCESLSMQLAGSIHSLFKTNTEISKKLKMQLKMDLLDDVKKQLNDIPTGLDSVLSKTITYACAFHHAGLTTEERDIVEASFKNGSLKAIVATSTLSSGVNLPARRVIIRSPLFGGKQMSSLTYKQMIGRAGRTGKDTLGESILICTDSNSKTGKDLIGADLQPISSCLNMQNSVHLKRALLEVISSGVATTKTDIESFVKCTLLSVQRAKESEQECEKDSQNCVLESIEFLKEYEFIRMQVNDETNEINYIATRLGMACLASSMPPTDGLILFSELQKSRRCFVLESELHAVYLVTPYSVCYQMQDIDWLSYLDMWEKLSPAMKKVGELVGVKESFLVRAMRGQTKLDQKLLQIHKRFYTALALQELVNEKPINEVATKFKCNRGVLQSLQQTSSTFAGIVTAFCNSLNFSTLSMIVSQFKERLFFGVHRDLVDLMRLPDINYKRARLFFDNGIECLIDLANADVFNIEKILYNSLSFDSAKQNENEDEFETNQRNNMRILYITGKTGLTIKNAAKMLIDDARKFVQYEIGVNQINWSQNVSKDQTLSEICNSELIKEPMDNRCAIEKLQIEKKMSEDQFSDTHSNKSQNNLKVVVVKQGQLIAKEHKEAMVDTNLENNATSCKEPSDKRNKERTKISDIPQTKSVLDKSFKLLGDKVIDHQSISSACRRSPRNHAQNNYSVNSAKSAPKPTETNKGKETLVMKIKVVEKDKENIKNPNTMTKDNSTAFSTKPIFRKPIMAQNIESPLAEPTKIIFQKHSLHLTKFNQKGIQKIKDEPQEESFQIESEKHVIEVKKEVDSLFQDSSFEMNSELEKAIDNKLKAPFRSPIGNKSTDEIACSQDVKIEEKTQSSRFMRSHKKPNKGKTTVSNEKNQNDDIQFEYNSSSIEVSDISESSLIQNPIQLNASHIMSTSKVEPESVSFNCINIIDMCGNMLLFNNCLKELREAKQFGIALGIQKLGTKRNPLIGGNLLINQAGQSETQQKMLFTLNNDTFVAGISFAINENLVFYFNMQTKGCCEELSEDMKITTILDLIGSKDIILKIFDAKEHIKILKKMLPNLCEINAKIEDPKVANWLLQPDKELNLNQLAKQFAPECTSLTEIIAKGRGYSSVALDYNSTVFPKIRSGIEACVTVHILNGQIENLQRIGSGQLYKFFYELEMPIQLSLAQMEVFGFAANEDAMRKLFQKMLETLKKLEQKIYELHGSRFNLSSTSAVARILGLHKKSNGRYSTSKQILEKIDSPISQLIVIYRKLSVTIQKTIQPLLKKIVGNRIYGHSITFSSTGRISMNEPSLQNVAKDFEVMLNGTDKMKISCRSAFFPSLGQCLISSDFCQLEMRILTHLSQDPSLISVMKSDKDVFTAIAAKWHKLSEDNITEQLRNGTKQICYGIIYGMGMRTLADSLKCTEHEANCLSEQFHLTYPGIRTYSQKVIKFARINGYVETITGRRRYLDHIASEEVQLKNQAERKAINTTIQGSAADIAKSAILRIEKNLMKYQNKLGLKKEEVNLVMHLHDELIYEIPENKVEKIAKVLRITMENCVKLSVPLHVKLKVGKTWGDLHEYK